MIPPAFGAQDNDVGNPRATTSEN